MSTLYRVRDWDRHFENNKSRERDVCAWCPIPNKQDGLGYGRLIRMRDGEAMYGAFMAVVLVASKQKRPRAGWLTDTGRADGVPYDADALSIKTQARAPIIARMLTACSAESIGWIETLVDGAPQVPTKCPSAALEEKGREEKEGKGKEGKGKEGKASDPRFEVWYETYFRKEKRLQAEAAWKSLTEPQKCKAIMVVAAWCRWKAKADDRSYWPMPASWLNGHRFDDVIPPELAQLCTRCGKEPRRPDSDMGNGCFKELGLGG